MKYCTLVTGHTLAASAGNVFEASPMWMRSIFCHFLTRIQKTYLLQNSSGNGVNLSAGTSLRNFNQNKYKTRHSF